MISYVSFRWEKHRALWCCLVFFLSACAGESSVEQPVPPLDTLRPIAEAELVGLLATEFRTDTSQLSLEVNALLDYAITAGVAVERHPAGFYYAIVEPGKGPRLEWGDYVSAHYRGRFIDGQVFDNSFQRNEPIEFYIGNMIPVWNEAVQLLAPGGSLLLLSPSQLAYGAKGLITSKSDTLVPPDQPLVFEIRVLEKLPKPN